MCYSAMVRQDLKYLERNFGATWVREQIDDYLRMVAQDQKRYPPLDNRIFPGHYAPVVYLKDNERHVSLMRYGAYPPPTVSNPKAYTTFNARRDNLTSSFWSGAFMKHHGFVALEGFFEWVAVKDLLQAGRVTLKEIVAEFDRQRELRKAKILEAGKKYKPTPTEMKDPMGRKIVIGFQPDQQDLLVPVIFSIAKVDGRWDAGFAIVTDDPPPEIQAAGHDRCPVILQEDEINEWIDLEGKSTQDFDELLASKRYVHFTHRLDEAA